MVEKPRLEVARFPRNATCAVTTSWDDNDVSNMEILRILDSMRLRGTFYVDLGNDGLNDSELRAIATTQEVGSHGWTHATLSMCTLEKMRDELNKSMERLQVIINKPVYGIAYPHGRYSQSVKTMTKECGYLFGRTTKEGSVEFPPQDAYAWGISVYASGRQKPVSKKLPSWKILFSKRFQLYAKSRTFNWYDLSLELFERARLRNGVWHLFGHASEALKPPTINRLMNVLKHVAGRNDTWYATNAMLFANESLKSNVAITGDTAASEGRFTFTIQAKQPSRFPLTPIPIRLTVPESWPHSRFHVNVNSAEQIETGQIGNQVWIDIFGREAVIECYSGE